MSKKVVLAAPPASFPLPIKFRDLDGSEVAIEGEAKYRTREEFGALIDTVYSDAPADPGAKAVAPVVNTAQQQQAATCKANGQYLHAILLGWNLDRPFTEAECIKFAGERPAGVQAFISGYRIAITEGRLGNW